VAMSIVPIKPGSLKYGSDDGGKTIHADVPELNQKMEEVAKALNIKKHKVLETEICGPGDIEGHGKSHFSHHIALSHFG